MFDGYRRSFNTAARARLKSVSVWQWVAISIFGAVALYYLSIPIVGPHYAKVCRKGEYGPPDECAYWDAVTAFVLSIGIWLDDHNGLVAAFAGVMVAAFTFVLWQSTEKLWSAGERQHALARDEFSANHRPIFRVRNINVKHIGGSKCDTIHLPGVGEVLIGQFYCANVGEADARILAAHLIFWTSKNPLPMKRPYEGEDENIPCPRGWIKPGASVPVLFASPIITPDITSNTFFDEGVQAIFAMGWVEYEDRGGNIRRTAFCRHYDTSAARFLIYPEGWPDYEAEE